MSKLKTADMHLLKCKPGCPAAHPRERRKKRPGLLSIFKLVMFVIAHSSRVLEAWDKFIEWLSNLG